MAYEYNMALMIGAGLSLLAALMHIGVIIGGPSWYHLFGAGDRFVRAAQNGRWFPAVVTMGITLVLGAWAVYALSGAGVIEPLPLLRPALCAITLIYLLRGLLGPFTLPGTGRSMSAAFRSPRDMPPICGTVTWLSSTNSSAFSGRYSNSVGGGSPGRRPVRKRL